MKIRVSNVTNSSSASFFLTVETVYSDMAEFKKGWEKFILECLDNEFSEKNENYIVRETQNIGIKHIGQNIFRLDSHTSMLNDIVSDLPKPFLRILLDVNREVALSKYGIKTAKLEVFEDNGSIDDYNRYPMEEEREKELKKHLGEVIKRIKKEDISAEKRWKKLMEGINRDNVKSTSETYSNEED